MSFWKSKAPPPEPFFRWTTETEAAFFDLFRKSSSQSGSLFLSVFISHVREELSSDSLDPIVRLQCDTTPFSVLQELPAVVEFLNEHDPRNRSPMASDLGTDAIGRLILFQRSPQDGSDRLNFHLDVSKDQVGAILASLRAHRAPHKASMTFHIQARESARLGRAIAILGYTLNTYPIFVGGLYGGAWRQP